MKSRLTISIFLVLILLALTILSFAQDDKKDSREEDGIALLCEDIDQRDDLGERAWALIMLSEELYKSSPDTAGEVLLQSEKLLRELQETTRSQLDPLANELEALTSKGERKERFQDVKVMLEDIKQPWVERELFFAGLQQGLWGYERLESVFDIVEEFNSSVYAKSCGKSAVIEQLGGHDGELALEYTSSRLDNSYFRVLALGLVYKELGVDERQKAADTVLAQVPKFKKPWVRFWALTSFLHKQYEAGDEPDARAKIYLGENFPGIPNPSRGFDAVNSAELMLDFWPQKSEEILKLLPPEYPSLAAALHFAFIKAGYIKHLQAFERNVRLIPDKDETRRIIPREEKDLRERFWLRAIVELIDKHPQKANEYYTLLTIPLYKTRALATVLSYWLGQGRLEMAIEIEKVSEPVLRVELYMETARLYAAKNQNRQAIKWLTVALKDVGACPGDEMPSAVALAFADIDPPRSIALAFALKDSYIKADTMAGIVASSTDAKLRDELAAKIIMLLRKDGVSPAQAARVAIKLASSYSESDDEKRKAFLQQVVEIVR